ncbi:MAG: hypothetical protein IE926_18105, partial [Micrococcales bacterium]|nr:hypothetical protein [Micrococcales bacterium]
LYSDLVIALRDTDGAPILEKYVVPATTETAESTEYCVQPVSYTAVTGVTATTNPVDGRTVWPIPLQGAWITSDPLPTEFTGACDPQPQYAAFVSEAELERLNLARTSDAVIARKLADVKTKFTVASDIALESTGRLTHDGTPIDASPENAAIYQSLMQSGTIPGLPTDLAGPPALVGPEPADSASNSQFDAWELAAMNIGAAASKTVPLSIDAIEYYNRVIGFPPTADPTATPPVPEYVSPWGVGFVRSEDPDDPGTEMSTGERFVDYSGFTYNRSQTFKGSVTWLDVPSLTWKVSRITDVVPFTNLSGSAIGTRTLTGVTAFAQLADDVRALCNYIPDNTFIPGFYMDVPGVDTTTAQQRAIVDPAVDLGTLPQDVFQTASFPLTASLLNPWGGTLVPDARLRITVDAPEAFTGAGDVTAVATGTSAGQSVPFELVDGNLVGRWGPDAGFPVQPGYNVSTTFDVTVADGSPAGDYTVTLELVRVGDPATVLAAEAGTITVHPNEATVLWGTPLPRLATQGVSMTIPLRVYSPEAGTGRLALTVSGPGDDPTTEQTEVTEAGDVKVYASNGTDMVAMPLALDPAGALVGTWDATLTAGFTPVSWYATVATGALVGNYAFGVGLTGGNTLTPIVVSVSAPESHGEKPPGAGEDTTAPVVTVTAVGELGSTASFTLSASEDPVTFECRLTTNAVAGSWASCTSPTTYTGLEPGDYAFSARATDEAGNVSALVTKSWTVPAPDTTAPVLTVTPVGVPGSTASFTLTADEDPVTIECQLTKDGTVTQAWAACTSPKAYSGLSAGAYVLSVRATDAAGNVSTLATTGWTVKAPAPTAQREDFTGDGRADLLARDTLGQLWLYPGNGRGGWLPRT